MNNFWCINDINHNDHIQYQSNKQNVHTTINHNDKCSGGGDRGYGVSEGCVNGGDGVAEVVVEKEISY